MSKIKTAFSLMKKPKQLIKPLALNGFLKWMPDKLFLEVVYWSVFAKKLNLKDPKTYNEKLQWLKLYNHNPEYTKMVDKYNVKKYVSDIIGRDYVIPTLGVWDKFDDIDFDKLPDKFVLKCTHDSGGLVICTEKASFDKVAACKKIEKCLKKDFYKILREWPYKNVPRRIIAEKYMSDNNEEGLTDYKFYCFNGKVELLMIASDRFTGGQTRFDYFDREYNRVEINWGKPNSDVPPIKPELFDEMVVIAEKLSTSIPHVRVDLYLSNHHIYFGEMTFFDGSGFTPMYPSERDIWLGSKIDLPKKINN